MAEALVGGAGLGAVLGELLKAIVSLSEKAIHFKPVLENTKLQVERLSSVIEELDRLDTNNLREVINKGKRLILKCDAVEESILKYAKTPFYTKKLRNFDAKLERASNHLLFQLNVEQIKILLAMGTNYANHASALTKLSFQFYHDKQLKGRIGPNLADALLGRVVEHVKEKDDSNEESGKTSRMIKELGEDRYEKIFHQTFETVADEKLQNWFRCDLLTEARRLTGVLFVSTSKLAFCSHKHIPPGKTKRFYLKVVLPFQLIQRAVGTSPSDKENIKVICVDNQEFQFMNFRNYNYVKKCLQEHQPHALTVE